MTRLSFVAGIRRAGTCSAVSTNWSRRSSAGLRAPRQAPDLRPEDR